MKTQLKKTTNVSLAIIHKKATKKINKIINCNNLRQKNQVIYIPKKVILNKQNVHNFPTYRSKNGRNKKITNSTEIHLYIFTHENRVAFNQKTKLNHKNIQSTPNAFWRNKHAVYEKNISHFLGSRNFQMKKKWIAKIKKKGKINKISINF